MSQSEKMLLRILIAVALIKVNSAEMRNPSRTFNSSESQLIKNHPWHDNTKLLYARCNSSQPQSGKKCVISMSVDAFESSTSTSECEVTLNAETSKGLVNDSLLVFKFASDKVIVVWMESLKTTTPRNVTQGLSMLKTSVVHMMDRCQIFGSTVHNYSGHQFTVEMAYQTYFNVIPAKDTYELILKDVMNDCKFRSNCTKGHGVFKFDAQAKRLTGPDNWPAPVYNNRRDVNIVVAVEPGHPDNGYFIFNRNQSQSIAYIAVRDKGDYKKLVLKETPNTKSTWSSVISLANHAIGICYHFTSNSSIVCWQFNQKGQVQLYRRISLKRPHEIPLAAVYNMNNGGVLIVAVDNDNSIVKIGKEGSVDVVKFRFDTKCGQQNNQITLRVFENKNNQYCVARLCENRIRSSVSLGADVRCFASSDFSTCNDCL